MSESEYIIEMNHITKEFPGIKANNDITLKLKKGEIHALLGENGAGKSTLMSVLFGLYQPEEGEILKYGKKVLINDPNDATKLGIGMVHQHFKLVECFTVFENIILGAEESTKFLGFIKKKNARKKIEELEEKYGLHVDLDAKIEDITVGMQQKTEILKMLFRDNEILIFDEPTAVLTPQEIDELMKIMKGLAKEGKSILFISHKLNEIMAVSDECTVLRKGCYIGTVKTKETTKEELTSMMVGRNVNFKVDKEDAKPGKDLLVLDQLTVHNPATKKDVVKNVSLNVREGEIVTIAGIDGNGQSELIQAISGLGKVSHGHVYFKGEDITHTSIKNKNKLGINHIPEDRHKHGLVLDFSLAQNMVLQRFEEEEFTNNKIFINFKAVDEYCEELSALYDVRSGQGAKTMARSMSGGNQQKAILAREIERPHKFLLTVQPTRGLDVGAIEQVHKQLIKDRDNGTGILLVSFELDEVMNLSDRILVMYEGEIVGEFDPKHVTVQELGLYMAGAKRQEVIVNE